MSEDRKIISLSNRQPIVIVEEPAVELTVAEQLDAERQKDIDSTLKALDEFRALVARGEVTGVCFVGRHLPTGGFVHDICPDFRWQPEEGAWATAMIYSGILEELRSEMLDIAAMRPILVLEEGGAVKVIEPEPAYEVITGDDDE